MAVRRVLVIYKCSRFARTDKHTPKQKLNKTKPNATKENGTKMGFARRLSAIPHFSFVPFSILIPITIFSEIWKFLTHIVHLHIFRCYNIVGLHFYVQFSQNLGKFQKSCQLDPYFLHFSWLIYEGLCKNNLQTYINQYKNCTTLYIFCTSNVWVCLW